MYWLILHEGKLQLTLPAFPHFTFCYENAICYNRNGAVYTIAVNALYADTYKILQKWLCTIEDVSYCGFNMAGNFYGTNLLNLCKIHKCSRCSFIIKFVFQRCIFRSKSYYYYSKLNSLKFFVKYLFGFGQSNFIDT